MSKLFDRLKFSGVLSFGPDSPWNKVVDGLTPVEGVRI